MNKQFAIKLFLLLAIFLVNPDAELSSQVNAPKNFPTENLIPENICLTTDRGIYISGENIWFSAICFLPGDDSIRSLSNTLYVELLDSKNNKVHRQKLKISKTHASGRIPLPHDLQTGYYFVRAFTTYARNFLPEYFPVKVVEIINPDIPPETRTNDEQEQVAIFPANEKIYSEISNPVAIRMHQALSARCDSIELVSRKAAKAVSKKIFHKGNHAFFKLMPRDSAAYYLKFYLNNKDTLLKQLQITDRPDFLISPPVSYTKPEFHFFSISGKGLQMRVRVFSKAGVLSHEEKIDASKVHFAPDPDDLSEGINYILFTDMHDSLLHFSTVFKPYAPACELNITTDKEIYQPREEVHLSIENPEEKLQIKDASISVVKKGSAYPGINGLPPYLIENIFLLTATDFGPETEVDTIEKLLNIGLILDKYKWHNSDRWMRLLKNRSRTADSNFSKMQLWLPETREILLSGIAKNKRTAEAIAEVPLIASVLFDRPQFHINTTDEEGNFFFSFYGLHNTKEIVILPLFQDTRAEIMVNSDFGAKHAHLTQLSLQYDSAESKLIRELYINAQLSEIFSDTANPEVPVNSPDIFGDLIEWTKPEDYIALPNLHEVFKEIVPSARLLLHDDKAVFGVLDAVKNVWYDNPLVLLDNIPINDADAVAEINPAAIEMIGVINSTYILGDHFLPGIIFLRSKGGKFAGVNLSDDAAFLEYQMYSPETSYNSVEYHSINERENKRADFRNTLYWNPDVNFESGAGPGFFTSDHISEYEIILEGYTGKGKPISVRKSFTVNKQD